MGKQIDGWNKCWSKEWLGSWGEVSNESVMQVPGTKAPGAGNTIGIDMYKVPRHRTVSYAAMNQANGATHIVYTHGQAADGIIDEITPEEMGIDGIWTHLCPSFKLSMKKLWAAGHF